MEKLCECCGHRINPRKESLSKGLVDTLIVFGRAVKRLEKNEIHLQEEVELNKNQYNNFQKLRYHGLVAKVKDRTGYWLLTRNGLGFLRGEKSVPKTIYIQNNRIVEHGDDNIMIYDYSELDGEYWQKEFSINIDNKLL